MYISESFINSLIGEETKITSLCEGEFPLCERIQFVSEGLGTLFTKIGEWFTNYRPKDPEFRHIRDRKSYDDYNCHTRFTEAKSQVKFKYDDDKQNWNTETTYDGFTRRPEYETCKMLAEYRYLKDIITLIKRKKFVLCHNNMNQPNCEQWITTNLPQLEEDLKFVKGMLESMGKDKGLKSLNMILA